MPALKLRGEPVYGTTQPSADGQNWRQDRNKCHWEKTEYLFFLTEGVDEIISRPTNLYAVHRLSKIFSKMGRVASQMEGPRHRKIQEGRVL